MTERDEPLTGWRLFLAIVLCAGASIGTLALLTQLPIPFTP